VVLFDIPEEKRDARDSLRTRLFNLGFHELQKSVWVHPFECRDEVEFLIELGDIRPYVRFMRAHHLDNEAHIKKFFHLS
jgi:CRISPR-associated endonuclease Cas2